jgi:hypothetical protein
MPRPVRTAPAAAKSPAAVARPTRAATRGATEPSASTRPAAAKGAAAGRRTPAKPVVAPVPEIAPATQTHAAAPKAAGLEPTASAPATPKRKKLKLVRDGFTMPEADYALLGALKKRALHAGHEVKKSELLRAGLRALAAMPEAAYIGALEGIERIKPGRPAAD